MSAAAKVERLLQHEKVPHKLIRHVATHSAQAEAAILHTPGKDVAKIVCMIAGGDAFLAVLPASHHVNLKKFARIVGAAPRLASETELAVLFPDCELGAMPPFGELYGVPVYVDRSLAAGEQILFSAGTHRDSIRMTYDDFERLSGARVCVFAEKG